MHCKRAFMFALRKGAHHPTLTHTLVPNISPPHSSLPPPFSDMEGDCAASAAPAPAPGVRAGAPNPLLDEIKVGVSRALRTNRPYLLSRLMHTASSSAGASEQAAHMGADSEVRQELSMGAEGSGDCLCGASEAHALCGHAGKRIL